MIKVNHLAGSTMRASSWLSRHALIAFGTRQGFFYVCASMLLLAGLMVSLSSTALVQRSTAGNRIQKMSSAFFDDGQDLLHHQKNQQLQLVQPIGQSKAVQEDHALNLDVDHAGDLLLGQVHYGMKLKEIHERVVRDPCQSVCTKSKALLKVFMYDLPEELHFGMIDHKNVGQGNTWPTNLSSITRYPGGLYQQHSPEYWLTLDLLSNVEEDQEKIEGDATDIESVEKEGEGNDEDFHVKGEDAHKDRDGLSSVSPKAQLETRPCGAIRVKDASDADVFFVPFFASLSYNKYSRLGMGGQDMELQKRVVDYVLKQRPWKQSKGRDHVIVMHHPNSLRGCRALLEQATFVVADFGRYSSDVANFGKDVVAPYKHIIPSFHEENGTSSFESRPTLLFFQGAIARKEGGIIRKKLYSVIKEERGVVFKDGIPGNKGIRSATKGMRSSKFCLHLAGDTPSSNRLFDEIASRCVPVIISKDIELPYEDVLDYSEFCLFVQATDALKKGFLVGFLGSIKKDEWTRMWTRLKEVHVHFEYQFPSQEGDAVQMIWQSIARKVPTIKQAVHKSRRYWRSDVFKRASSF